VARSANIVVNLAKGLPHFSRCARLRAAEPVYVAKMASLEAQMTTPDMTKHTHLNVYNF